MKKILSFIILAFGFVGLANAQQQVTLGTTHPYNVVAVAGYTYTWTVDVVGTNTDVSAVTGNSISIDWNQAAGNYNITVFATETATTCISETETISVEVLGASSVLFAAVDNATTCSDLDGNVDGGGASGGSSSFSVQFTDGLAPYDLVYRLLDPTDTPIGADVTLTDVTAATTITVANQFINGGITSVDYKVVLVSAITDDGAAVLVDADVAKNTRIITVLPKPTITGGIIF
tara:strand:- start:8666 stop:9364 length:699 start_codon:yes stop_codon:yes gene_type:complete